MWKLPPNNILFLFYPFFVPFSRTSLIFYHSKPSFGIPNKIKYLYSIKTSILAMSRPAKRDQYSSAMTHTQLIRTTPFKKEGVSLAAVQ